MIIRKIFITLFFVASFSTLASCDTAEERAEKHFQSALALLAEGDQERAIVEFRNVFKLNGLHREARSTYADLQRSRGNKREATGQFLRLVEQYPDDLPGRLALAELYFEGGNLIEVERHVEAALKSGSDDPKINAFKTVVDYAHALDDEEDALVAQAVTKAAELKSSMPDFMPLRRILIDSKIRENDFVSALAEVDEALEIAPEDRELHNYRLSLLSTLGDEGALEAHLKFMVDKFPEDTATRTTLVRWYVSQGQIDDAELFLRGAIIDGADNTPAQLTLVRFLTEFRSREIAIEELNGLIAGADNQPIFGSLKAGLEFENGNRDQAISEIRNILIDLEPSDESRSIKIGLARMLIATDNSVGARALVEEVLAEDVSQVEALKMRASWLIDDDQVGEAIIGLRSALDQSPRDPQVMTLMARAYNRDGNQELVGEMLSLAVEASNSAPDESLRYAQYLSQREKHLTAEEIIINALRLAPQNVQLLAALGNVYIAMEDWSRGEQVAATLNRLESPRANNAGNSLTANLLQSQRKTDETITYLEGLIDSGEAGLGANTAIIRSYLTEGNIDAAQNHMQELLAENPDSPALKFIGAAVSAASGNLDQAEVTYRELLAEDDKRQQVWVALFRILSGQNKIDEASEVVTQATTALPNDATLKWINAGLLERNDKIDDAIEIYEGMYAENSDNLVIANNLASLLSSHRTDAESIERAFTIARRLRSLDIPPYQDTYGWIAHLRGDHAEAVKALEPAAAALANDPAVQYHLAKTYSALERPQDALAQYSKVLDLTSEADTREFVTFSRNEVNRLRQAEADNQ